MMNITDKIYHDEEAARLHLEELRWSNGVHCPHCGGTEKCKTTKMMSKPSKVNPEPQEVKGYYHCGDCRKRFTVRTGSVYERSHIPLHKWVLATHLMAASKKGMSAHQLHRMLGVTYKTAWFMAHRIREAMNDTSPDQMGGDGESVQADETYFGSKDEENRRTTRVFDGLPYKKNSRGPANKRAVVSLICEGKSRTFHVDSANVETVTEILRQNVSPFTILHTDESRLYSKVGKDFADHQSVKHSAGEYWRDGVSTNKVENFFSIFKRGMKGVYQHCSEKHLQRYLSEFDFRYNTRDLTDAECATLAIKGAEGKRLMYAYKLGYVYPDAAFRVFFSRKAMVIGPTPPGTGVMAPAISMASLKFTSPTSRVLPSFSG
jgi:transposase-like protein